MTYRDDPPAMPSCPFCGSAELVGKDVFGQHHKRGAYLCGGCWSVFTGSQDEWHQLTGAREIHRRRQEARGECSTSN